MEKKMRKGRLLAAMALSAVAMFAFSAAPALAGISATKHNLGSTGGAGQNKVSDTAEICVFCHTPHGADTAAVVPLWNKKLGDGTGYTTYASLGTTTLDGKTATNVGSVSLACLSCHDGTQAMDNIINAPGSGGYDATGGGATGLAYNWGTSPRVDADGKLNSGVALIGTDLSNDHPVGIQYAGGGYYYNAGFQTGTIGDPDFKTPSTLLIGSTPVWWVDTSGAGTREKVDMILYTRTAADGYTGQTNPEPFVECASCHNPHTSATNTFLRVSNDGSAVCLACHVK